MSLALITYQAGKLFPLACSPTGGWRCLTAPSVAAWACTLCLRRCIWPPLAFDANLQAKQAQARCGPSVIEELYDVTVLPGVRRAMAVGVHTDQIRRVGAGEAAAVRYGVNDVDRDGDADLLLFFKTREIGIVCGDTEASVTGDTLAGQAITGTDAVKTVGCKTHGPKT